MAKKKAETPLTYHLVKSSPNSIEPDGFTLCTRVGDECTLFDFDRSMELLAQRIVSNLRSTAEAIGRAIEVTYETPAVFSVCPRSGIIVFYFRLSKEEQEKFTALIARFASANYREDAA